MDHFDQLHSELQDLRDDLVEVKAGVVACTTRLEEHGKQDADNFAKISASLDKLHEGMGAMRESLAESRGQKELAQWIWGAILAVGGLTVALLQISC